MARNPFDHTVNLEPIPTKKHHVKIKDWKTGKTVFEQEDVEAPETWSDTAVNIATSRWFRGKLGTPERETSTEQMFRRVAREITTAGVSLGHIKADERQGFEDYLVLLQQHQKGVFNTPVYLNAGWTEDPRTSACFLLAVEDNYESLTHHTEVEARVFQHGGGAGVYVGNISHEGRALSKGGYASGPLYFNEGWDRSSGAIKSGGSHRRAARDVTLPIDHPDCYRDKEYLASLPVAALDTDFIREKQIYEQIRKDLASLGHDVSMNSLVDYVLPAQNANRAVLVYDKFLQAVKEDKEWDVICPRTKEVVWTYQAKTVWEALCYATWYAADPTIKFFDNINDWNVCTKGRITLKDGTILDLDNMEITTSNPCGSREMRLKTRGGYKEIGFLEESGKTVEIWDGKAFRPAEFKVTGRRQLCKIVLEDGRTLRFTPDHVFFAYDIHSEFVYEEQVEVKNLLGWYLYDEEKNVVDEVDSALVQVVGLELCEGTELVYDFTMLEGEPYAICEGFKVHNCNEVIYPVPLVSGALIACNLAMLRLTKYFDTKTQRFDVDAYIADVRVLLTCQDIIVDYASYPTEIGTEWTRANRILGLSISDLGGLLMLRGLPYDSDEGRTFAKQIAALHFFAAYNHSTHMAESLGPCENYERNRDQVRKVFNKHRDAWVVADFNTAESYLEEVVSILISATSKNLDSFGLRNMQVVPYAPQGTTGMITDCYATGPEPLIAIQSFKTLSGGGTVIQAPPVVAVAMEAMGLDPDAHYKELVETGTLEGYPDSVVKVFETALGISVGNEVKLHIHPNGHVDMIAAVQPFISGSASKTCNVPNSYTPQDIGALYMRAWEKGVKAISIYRDGCKGAQPVSIKKEEKKEDTEQAEVIDSALVHNLQEQIANLKGELSKRSVPIQAHRVKLPDSVCSQRLKLRMAGHELYMHVGLFEDGSIGEVFLTGVQGSFVAGMVDAFATLLSLGLQYGVPFEDLYRKFEAVSFAPQGFVAGLGFCASIPALVVKSLKVGIDTGAYKRYADAFYGKSHSEVLPVVESVPVEAGSDVSDEDGHTHTVTGEPCPNCGSLLVQTGKCKTCVSCGYNSGGCG
jgi:ribonucleotide reductase alpha subunit